MKKLLGVCAVFLALMTPALVRAQDDDHRRDRDDEHRQNMRHVLPPDDQRNFDSYYSRWLDYRRDKNHEQVESMEKRMHHVMARNHIPPDVPFDQIASNGGDRDRDHRDDDRRDDDPR